MTCTSSSINGINKDCEAFLSAAKVWAITDPSLTFATLNAAKSSASWVTYLQTKPSGYSDIPMFLTLPVKGYEVTAPEPVIESDNFGVDTVVRFLPPKATAMLKSNPCDFRDLLSLGKQTKRVFAILEDGKKYGYMNAAGVVKGFEAQIAVQPIGIPDAANLTQQFKLIINFKNVDEFQNYVLIDDDTSPWDLIDEMPVGYNQTITSALSSASMSVKLTKRCDEATLGEDTFTSEIIEYHTLAGTVPSVSVGAITAGVSELTIYSTGTTDLAAGEWVKYRLVKKTTTVYDEVTNILVAKL